MLTPACGAFGSAVAIKSTTDLPARYFLEQLHKSDAYLTTRFDLVQDTKS